MFSVFLIPMAKKPVKLCLACSAGGHLSELMQLQEFYSRFDHYFVSDHRTNAIDLSGQEKVHFVECPRRHPLKFLKNFFQSWRVFWKEKPDVVISTGADTAFFTCILAKAFGKKLVFIESLARITGPSLSGKFIYPLADLFFIQWPENKAFFPKGIYAGGVF
jgi:UDP-N-acetylglucosamine:LPS N-acetylglucosamine transferase